MAFRPLPLTRPAPPRLLSHQTTTTTLSTPHTAPLSEEWILFSPHPTTTATQTASLHSTSTATDRTPRTLAALTEAELPSAPIRDEDLDSLDDNLHSFHEPTLAAHLHSTSAGRLGLPPILPAHDGLGSFAAEAADLQRQVWLPEASLEADAEPEASLHAVLAPPTPQSPTARRRARAESVARALRRLDELDASALATAARDDEAERVRRIEAWRLGQSRAVLEEMEREARRSKRRRTGSGARVDVGKAEGGKEGEGEGEGFWARVTRRVIRDLMGIDEELLEVILGEALPDVAEMREEEEVGEDMEGSWQARLLDRIARELGLLVHHLRASESAAHPGAFTTYPPSAPPLPQASTIRPTPQPSSLDTSTSDQEPIFAPTLAFNPPDATLWGIEEEPSPGADAEAAGAATAGDTPIDIAEREFWERDLALGTVFAYLKARFQGGELPLPSSLPAGSGAAAGPSAVSPSSPPASGREEGLGSGRAAREGREGRMAWVRRVHPLATAAPTGPVVGRAFAARARSESCASQSSRLSKRTGSSRNYWDIGGSGSGEIGFGV